MNSVEILKKLVSFNTVSDRSNLELIAWTENYLRASGIYCEQLDDEDGLDKASLLARIGAPGDGGLIFSGHTDVVPVTGQAWHSDPFTLREDETRYYGRGVCDMKGFIASALAAAPRWQRQALTRPVYLALSYDEEVGCDKAPHIARRLIELGAKDAFAIIGEPTLLAPVVGQKGIVNLRTTVYGQAAHSSQILHQGVSAVHEAGKLIARIEQVMHDLVAEGKTDPAYNVAHSSLHVGTVAGGIAHNILAESCTLEWEIRNLPQHSLDDILERVNRYAQQLCAATPGLRIESAYSSTVVPGLENRDNADLLALLQKHQPQASEYVAYATEAGHFQQAGFQAVICGPGSILQAHQADEWLAKSQLQACDEWLAALVADHCRPRA